jgi:hypothetical protein
MNVITFRDIAPSSLVGVDRSFRRSMIIALTMEAAGTSETSVYFNEGTRRYNPEGYHLKIVEIKV